MSIIHAIKNCRKHLNSGADRYVTYSKKYDVIIKRNLRNYSTNNTEQTEQEVRIFGEMTEEEKEIFPIVDIVYLKNEKVILMKKCTPLSEYREYNLFPRLINSASSVRFISETLSLDLSYIDRFVSFIVKHELEDIYRPNVGVYNNHLVILDAGY